MTRICRLVIFVWLACLATSEYLLAQELRIFGTVDDGTGVLTDATVSLRDPIGVTRQITTDSAGQYIFDGLRAGAYEITAIREGFISATRALTLTGESRIVDITLQVSGVATSIEVTGIAGRSTASGMDIPNREVPNYIATVPSRVLQEQGINDLPAALENISGVMTQVQYGVYEWYTIGGITQQSGNDFLYVDGMTLTGNRSATQLNNIEEVQVFKGPNSILYGGSGAGQGGMVNLIRKKPQAVPVHDIQYRFGRWGLQEVAVGTAGAVFGLGRLMYRVDAGFSHRDGWRQNGANRFNVSPALTWLITDRMRVTTIQALIRDRYTLDGGVPTPLTFRQGFPFDRKLNPEGDFQLTRDWQNELVYSWNVTNRLTLSNAFFTRKNRDQYLDAEGLSYNPALDQVNRTILYFQHNRRPIQDEADVTGDYNLWGMRHRFLGRYEYSRQHNFSNRTAPQPGQNDSGAALPLPPVPVPAFIDGTWVDPAPRYTVFPITRVDFSTNRFHGAVLQDQVNPVRWLGFNFTVSRRKYRRNTHNDAYDNGRLLSVGNNTLIRNNTRSNYRVGVALIPQEGWGRFIRGFQPYFSYNDSFNPVNQVQADGRPLDPVLNKSVEIGNKWQGFGNRLSVLTAVRRIQDRNRVVNLGMQMFDQIGTTTTYNADVDIQGNIGSGIWLLANWGYADSRIEPFRADGTPQPNAGRRFPHAPRHTSRVWITKTFRLEGSTSLSVSLGQRYVGRYFMNAANTTIMPSLGTADGAISLRRGKYDVAVNFGNLLDKDRYFDSQINGGAQLYPGEPFNATLTVRYRFQ
jgi:iron complex outermembrane recepter protein